MTYTASSPWGNRDGLASLFRTRTACLVRTLLNIIYSKHSFVVPEVAIGLDAEKAFDRCCT